LIFVYLYILKTPSKSEAELNFFLKNCAATPHLGVSQFVVLLSDTIFVAKGAVSAGHML
jgi:hypothetical protein